MADQAYIDALLRERRGYEIHGKADRVKDVDAALAAAGYTRPEAKKAAPKERAVKPAKTETRDA
jgi:hypothetical protein